MRSFAIVLALSLVAGAAQAQRVSKVNGLTLLKACTSPTLKESCDAYVDGFGDAISEGGKEHALACLPIASTGTELRDVLVAYLKAHPEDQHLKAGTIASRVFSKAYPCHR